MQRSVEITRFQNFLNIDFEFMSSSSAKQSDFHDHNSARSKNGQTEIIIALN